MKNYINKHKRLIKYLLFIFLICLLFTIFEYIGLSFNISSKGICISSFIITFIYSYKIGLESYNKGYKCGLKVGSKIVIILTILNLILLNGFSFNTLIYYLIIMSISVIGSIVGKNHKKSSS